MCQEQPSAQNQNSEPIKANTGGHNKQTAEEKMRVGNVTGRWRSQEKETSVASSCVCAVRSWLTDNTDL